MNHLNQERASLLEKIEHYERDLHPSLGKANDIRTDEFGMRNVRDDLNNDSRDTHVDTDFEFYFEKNYRP